MKRKSLFALLGCLLCLMVLPALAQADGLPTVNITYAPDATLSQEQAVDAQVTLTSSGEETSFAALLRLNDKTQDKVEITLPQQSLRIDGDAQRFVLYNGGNDGIHTRVIDAVCGSLIAQGTVAVPVRAQEPVEVYLNGEYWGLYIKRETIEDAIARFEGLPDAAVLNVAGANGNAICGDASGLAEAFRRAEGLDLSNEADRQTLNGLIDTESLLNWLAVNTYFGTADLYAEVFFYQAGDDPWKCAAGDFAFALLNAEDNTVGRVVAEDAAQPQMSDALALARKMLAEPSYREAFLTKLGALYQALSTPVMQAAADAESARIAAALPAHTNRWAEAFAAALGDEYGYPADAQEAALFWQYRLYRLRDKTMLRRPWYVYDSAQSELNVSDEDMARYFGGAKPELPEVNDDTWEEYREAHR